MIADSDCFNARIKRWRERRRQHGAPTPGSKAVRDAVLASAPTSDHEGAQSSSDDDFQPNAAQTGSPESDAGQSDSPAQQQRVVQAIKAAFDAEEAADAAAKRGARAAVAASAAAEERAHSGDKASSSAPASQSARRRSGRAASAGAAAPAEAAASGVDDGEAAEALVRFNGGFQMPASTYDRLFPYQQVGVKWLWELHLQRAGGAP